MQLVSEVLEDVSRAEDRKSISRIMDKVDDDVDSGDLVVSEDEWVQLMHAVVDWKMCNE
tara:strand:- start:168 stop:344 length:177 start_codon:yes stop_codon:yes gene_type:complete